MKPSRTISLCPDCFQRIPADYTEHDGTVVLEKKCPEHGLFRVPVWDSPAAYEEWIRGTPAQAPKGPLKPVERGCPYDCGLCETHEQASCCVLLEVTNRCNLNCPVCFADAGQSEADDPSIETIRSWYQMLLDQGGPFNIQLSGGEPSLRDNLPEIIRLGKDMGFKFFQLNTNGIRIAQDKAYLNSLVEAGLSTVFLQFDSLQESGNQALRGKDLRSLKEQAIRNCQEAGVGVVLVPTVRADVNLSEVGEIVQFAAKNMPTVRGVHFQPMAFFGRYDETTREKAKVTIPGLLKTLEETTNGAVKQADFSPGSAEHSLCTFYADYRVVDGIFTVKKSSSMGCCGPTSDQARDVVAMKWSAPLVKLGMKSNQGYNASSLDEFLNASKQQNLAISGMAFQDVWSVDLSRLHRCHVHVVSQDGELKPFCSYNLTNRQGEPLHRVDSVKFF